MAWKDFKIYQLYFYKKSSFHINIFYLLSRYFELQLLVPQFEILYILISFILQYISTNKSHSLALPDSLIVCLSFSLTHFLCLFSLFLTLSIFLYLYLYSYLFTLISFGEPYLSILNFLVTHFQFLQNLLPSMDFPSLFSLLFPISNTLYFPW